jgi:hypothetical protein
MKFPRASLGCAGGMIAVGTNEIMRLVIQREVYDEFSKRRILRRYWIYWPGQPLTIA